MERTSLKISKSFLDLLRFDVFKKDFPYRNFSSFITLATWDWVLEYQSADDVKRKQMIERLKIMRLDAENSGYLHNSREIDDNANA